MAIDFNKIRDNLNSGGGTTLQKTKIDFDKIRKNLNIVQIQKTKPTVQPLPKIETPIAKQEQVLRAVNKSSTLQKVFQAVAEPVKLFAKSIITKKIPTIREVKTAFSTPLIKEQIYGKPFFVSDEEQQARDWAVVQLTKQTGLDQSFVDKHLSDITKELGIRQIPTTREVLDVMITLPVVAGLMTNPVTTILGVGGFVAITEAISYGVSKAKKEPFKLLQSKGLSELLPDATNQLSRDVVDILQFFGTGVLLNGAYKKAPELKVKLTKDFFAEYKFPEKLYIEGNKVKSIFQTGEKISLQEMELVKSLGLTGQQYKNAFENGLSIEVPATEVVTMTDKPYWSKIKSLFKVKPTSEVISTSQLGKPKLTPRALLQEGKPGEIIPQTPDAKLPEITPTPKIDFGKIREKIKIKEEPKLEKPTITKQIQLTTTFDTPETEMLGKIESELLDSLKLAEAGKRQLIRTLEGETMGIIGVKSSFPDWLPQDLRLKKIIDPTLEHIMSGTLPLKVSEIRLYNLIQEKIDSLANAKDEIVTELNLNLEDPFAEFEKKSQQIDDLITKTQQEYDNEKLNLSREQITDIESTQREIKKTQTDARKWQQDVTDLDAQIRTIKKPSKEKSLIDGSDTDLNKAHGLTAKKWSVKMAQEPEVKETINKTEILSWAEKTFNVPIKSKVTHKWKMAGMYYPQKQIIRMEKWGEFSVFAHELSHHIDLTTLKKSHLEGWRKGSLGFQKELADLDYDQTKRRTTEGFAEYMRYRLTTDEAQSRAPVFHAFFNEFLQKNPKLKNQLAGLQERFDIWHKQGAENRIIQHIDWKGEYSQIKGIVPKLKLAFKFIQEKFNDEFYTPQKIVRGIEAVIGRRLKPTENPAKMMEYSKSKAGSIARTFIMDAAIDEYGGVLGPSMVEILKPISNKEIRQFIAYAVSKRALNLAERNIESGFDIDDAKFVVEKYKDRGWDEQAKGLTDWSNHLLGWLVRAGGLDTKATQLMRDLNPIYLPFKRAFLDSVGVIKGGGGFVDTGVGVQKIKGSARPIINPIEAMIAQTRELIGKAQKLRVAKLFADLSYNEGLGGFITEVPAPMKATTFSAEKIKGYVEEVGGDTANLDDFLTVFTQDFAYRGKENIISIWRNGEQKFYEIHPDLYESFKGIDPLKLGPVAKLLAPFSRMLRLGATGLKVSFGLARNPFRDALSYVVFSERKTATIFDPVLGMYQSVSTKPGELTWRFKKLGGALSGQIGYDRSATMDTYDEVLQAKLGVKGKVLKIVKHPINALRDILSVTEMGPRSSELEKNYDMHKKNNPSWSEEDIFVQSFLDAQDVTVNFTKSGKWAKQLNEISAFFNVAIRGPEKLYRTMRNKPIQTTVKGLLWLTLIAIGSWYKNKDKEWYKNLPPAYKYNNLYFEIGDNVFRLPIPFELGMLFMAAPQAMLDNAMGDDEALKGLLEIAKSQVPDPTPSAFGPIIDVASNRNYMGIPIESEGMQYLYPTERKKDYTSRFAIETSKGLDKIGIHLSPVQLDYLLNTYSGGFGRQFDFANKSQLEDLPILSDIMLKDKDFPRRQVNEFFNDYEYLSQKKHSDLATREDLLKLYKIDGFYKLYNLLSKMIKEAKKNKNEDLVKRTNKTMSNLLKKYGYD